VLEASSYAENDPSQKKGEAHYSGKLFNVSTTTSETMKEGRLLHFT